MKRLLICIICLTPMVASAQSDSTAIRIVNRYLDIMNIEALPQDSMLVVNTTITYPTTGDTLYMKRLYAPPQMFRVEVRLPNGTLQTGLCSNGKKRFRLQSEREKLLHLEDELHKRLSYLSRTHRIQGTTNGCGSFHGSRILQPPVYV